MINSINLSFKSRIHFLKCFFLLESKPEFMKFVSLYGTGETHGMYPRSLKRMGTLPGEATLGFIFASHLISGQLLKKITCFPRKDFFVLLVVNLKKKKRLFSPRNSFFSYRVDPILKVLHYPGKQTGSHKSCVPL